jgi:predicted dehydrogenase
MNTRGDLGAAVVGLGYWGPNLLRNLHELEGVEVRYACDLNLDALGKAKRRYPALSTTVSFDEVLGDATVDIVLIATPVGTHFELASAALAAGKHVFVEKPLAGSVAESLELIEIARRAGKVLMPGHTFLYSPPVNLVKSLIDAGDLGEIYFISTSRVNLGLHQSDASVAWDLGPHDFSILRFWLDESPTHATALSRGCVMPHIPDVAFINLEYASKAIAHVELSWLAPSKLRRTTVVGSERMVVYDDTSSEPVRVFDSGVMLRDPETFGEYKLTYRTGDIVSPHITAAEPLSLELDDFCNAVRTGGIPRSSSQVGLDVVRTIDAVDRSLESNGARVEVAQGRATVTV